MMTEKFNNDLSPELQGIVREKAETAAKADGRTCIYPRDLILCFWGEDIPIVSKIVEIFGIDRSKIIKEILNLPLVGEKQSISKKKGLDSSSAFILQTADRIVTKLDHQVINVEHVILAFVEYGGRSKPTRRIKDLLLSFKINSDSFRKYILEEKRETYNLLNSLLPESASPITKKGPKIGHGDGLQRLKDSLIKSGFIEDLNARMSENEEKFIGREKEIQRCIRVLSRKKKKNVIIIGDSGTGKTALVEGLSKKIAKGEVPESFQNTEIYGVNLGNLVSGTKYRGQFEERMKSVLSFMEGANNKKRRVVMFFDEIQTLINTGAAEGSINASTMVKPLLSRGTLQCIGTITREDYRKVFQKDDALVRRFSNVSLDEPSAEETENILTQVKDEYEDFHSIKVSPEAVSEIIKISDRYLVGKQFPDKAIDVLDEACVRDGVEGSSEDLRIETVHQVISDITGIPLVSVSGEERKILALLEEKIKESIIGQDSAVETVSDAIKTGRVGIKDPNQPIGVFLFLGPTGVGKTYTSQKLSEILFGDNKMIRLDMSEYMDKISINKIIGSPPGYIGYDDGSQVGEEIRKRPYSVLLLDEIEKAHKDVLNVFLQIFGEGRLTDNMGKLIDFRNTIIIMTSNLSTAGLEKRSIGFNEDEGLSKKEAEAFLRKAAGKYFSPEFLNRIDEVVIFNKISKENIEKIFDIEFSHTVKRSKQAGYPIEISNSAKKLLCEKGYSDKFGARQMKRAIKQEIENSIAAKIISEEIREGFVVYIDSDGEGLTFQEKSE